MAKKINEKISRVLSIPQEIITDVPRIVFESNTAVHIENYKGISEYSKESIKINTGKYLLSFEGENMEIKFMTVDEITIEGNITALKFS